MATLTRPKVSFLDICPEWALIESSPTQSGTISRSDLQPAPLNPDWILNGSPTARSLPLGEAPDGNLSFGLWDCTSGQFIFKYRSDELVHILEGEAVVRGPGITLHLQPGVVAFFPKGSTMHWTINNYIKKLAIFRSVEPSVFARIASRLKRACRNIAQVFPSKRNEKSAHAQRSRSLSTQPVAVRSE